MSVAFQVNLLVCRCAGGLAQVCLDSLLSVSLPAWPVLLFFTLKNYFNRICDYLIHDVICVDRLGQSLPKYYLDPALSLFGT